MPLHEMLARVMTPSISRGFRSSAGGAVHIGTDVGLRRKENQDRVAVVRWRPHPDSNRGSTCAIVVSDGMGGMKDGAACAARTVATFIASLVESRSFDIDNAVRSAIFAANEHVYVRYGGEGGATLSVLIVMADGQVIGANVGDSRVYASSPSVKSSLIRLTVDDTLRDAYGSENKDLLQYVGIGPGLVPHTFHPDQIPELAVLTTDGAHFFDQDLFAQIIENAQEPKPVVERIVALSRWLGAPDNTTVATVDIRRLAHTLNQEDIFGVEVIFGGTDATFFSYETASDRLIPNENDAKPGSKPVASSSEPRKRRQSRKNAANSPEQLSIDVEVSNGGQSDDNS